MAFIIVGDPEDHGGEGCPAPVLVMDAGGSFRFVSPGRLQASPAIEYANRGLATAAAARIPGRLEIVEVSVDSGQQGVGRYTEVGREKHGGKSPTFNERAQPKG